MKIIKTKLEGCLILEPQVYTDQRGYFFESFNKKQFNEETGLQVDFVQDNQSFSSRGVIRGLHGQLAEHAQAKLVRVFQGDVIDVAVDARPESKTFGQYLAVNLSAENKRQLFVPRGFLHGFAVLSETAGFFYKCDNYYQKDAEWGVDLLDEDLAIDWQLAPEEMIISEKDLHLPSFKQAIDRYINK